MIDILTWPLDGNHNGVTAENVAEKYHVTREEQDAFYSQFFDCAGKFLKNGGHMILYSNEGGFVKKQLRRHMEYRLLDEFCIREKEGFYLFIVGKKG